MKNLHILVVIVFGVFACKENNGVSSNRLPALEQPSVTATATEQPVSMPCKCPGALQKPHVMADTFFLFSNDKAIGLCGAMEINEVTKLATFSTFKLFVCGEDAIIATGGNNFQNSKVILSGDTLLLTDRPMLPTGENFASVETTWSIEKIYFEKDRVKTSKLLNRSIRKYNRNELLLVQQAYEAVIATNANLDKITERLLARLFVAALSGDKKSRMYFFDLPNKFEGLDGAYAALYNNYKEKLTEWDKY